MIDYASKEFRKNPVEKKSIAFELTKYFRETLSQI